MTSPSKKKQNLVKRQSKTENISAENELLQRLHQEAPDIIGKISHDNQIRLVQITSQVVARSHRGPLPRPEDIALYNQHIPDGADRIMRMAEKQSDHRIEIETKVIHSQQSQSSRGQIFGLIIGTFGISVGAFVAIMGHDVVGGAIAGTTVISLVYAFVTGQRSQKENLAKKS